jgi:hypothetical protein
MTVPFSITTGPISDSIEIGTIFNIEGDIGCSVLRRKPRFAIV